MSADDQLTRIQAKKVLYDLADGCGALGPSPGHMQNVGGGIRELCHRKRSIHTLEARRGYKIYCRPWLLSIKSLMLSTQNVEWSPSQTSSGCSVCRVGQSEGSECGTGGLTGQQRGTSVREREAPADEGIKD